MCPIGGNGNLEDGELPLRLVASMCDGLTDAEAKMWRSQHRFDEYEKQATFRVIVDGKETRLIRIGTTRHGIELELRTV